MKHLPFSRVALAIPKLRYVPCLLALACFCAFPRAEVKLFVEPEITPEIQAEVRSTINEFSAALRDDSGIKFEKTFESYSCTKPANSSTPLASVLIKKKT